MFENLTNLVGLAVMILGGLIAVVAWFRNKSPATQQQVDSITSRILEKHPSSRLDALKDCDSLMQYFEESRNAEGVEALRTVVSQLFNKGPKL